MKIKRESFMPDEIVVPPRLRDIIPNAVNELMESIKLIGLQTPLTVRWDKRGDEGNYVLVAGRHRLEACLRLGIPMVECTVFEGSEDDARLWEISENLHRAELTALQHDEHVAEWIRLTCEVQSAQSAPLESKRLDKRGHRTEGGINAAVRELGVERTAAQRAVKVASLSDEAKSAARDVGLDDNRSALLRAASEASPERQLAAVRAEVQRRARKPAPLPRNNINIPVPSGLIDRARRLADAEGIDVAAFINRCVEDAVGTMEAANEEIDAIIANRSTGA